MPSRAAVGARANVGAFSLATMLVVAALMVLGYFVTQREVTLFVDGHARLVRTHQTTVAALFDEIGLALHDEDIVVPSKETRLENLLSISVTRARSVVVEADGDTRTLRTHSQTVGEVLQQAGIALGPHDRVAVAGQDVSLYTLLVALPTSSPPHLTVRRARPITVSDDGVSSTIFTLAPTLGEALWREGVRLYLGDRIVPDLSTPIISGLRVFIQRSKPITIVADGRVVQTRTRAKTVALALPLAGFTLRGKDYTRPTADTPINDGLNIEITRVNEETIIEQEAIPFETAWRPDDKLELDTQQVVQRGAAGIKKRSIRIIYENGREVRRVLEKEWVDTPPTTRIVAYGRKIVVRELQTEAGTLHYWRKMRVLATSYTAATSGKKPGHPHYGITYLGLQAGYGIIAVDPKVIPLRSKMYVPGYGAGMAGDTGGRIKGKRIDLGYDEDNLVPWYKWVDIYLLTPVPPPDQIRWILPSWPVERQR